MIPRQLALLAAGHLTLAACSAGSAPARAETMPPPSAAPESPAPGSEALHLLDVPFVPQSQALCGGAAVAMVMRFWGEPAVRAEDFAALVGDDGAGIRAVDLVRAVRERGWRSLPFDGGFAEAQLQLQRGRPIVALLREPGGSNHYVVLVGACRDRALLHDSARGPFRVVEASRLQQAWRDAGSWGLLILPPEGHKSASPPDTAFTAELEPPTNLGAPRAGLDGCTLLVDRGVLLARGGDLDAAEQLFDTARALCPGAPAPLRELAGVRFRQKRWRESELLAESAARLQPEDAYTWELLATTRFVRGDAEAALTAWNQVREPHVDLTRIDGLERTRYDVVAQLLDLPPGALLTGASLRRSRRRLQSLPSGESARLEYLPLPGGVARVDVNVLERPAWSLGARAYPAAAWRAIGERTLRLELATPTGNGELWSASWRWWKERPALTARLDLPAAWSVAGIWHVETSWERQAYRLPGSGTTRVVALERRRSAVGCGQWTTADLHWALTGALEHWTERGQDAVLELGLERRAATDRLVLCAETSRAWSTRGRPPYSTGGLLAGWRSSAGAERQAVRLMCHAGMVAASPDAPILLWPRAGTGPGSPFLLRAHPLLDRGVLSGKGMGRELAHGGVELQWWPCRTGLVSLGLATFIDVAKPGSPLAGYAIPLQLDAGTGLRLGVAAQPEHLRLDLARDTRNGRMVISLGIETERWFDK